MLFPGFFLEKLGSFHATQQAANELLMLTNRAQPSVNARWWQQIQMQALRK
jgi:hypothetical protein